MSGARPGPTPGQTVGPFFSLGLVFERSNQLVPAGHADALTLRGRVLDGDGQPVPDALVELWQAGADGRQVRAPGSLRRDETFTGWGRCATDESGAWSFTTIRPAAPFFALTVFARGLLDGLFTRAYLPDSPDDALLSSLDAARRQTLRCSDDGGDLVLDIRLQGEDETVFLAYARD